MDLYHIQIVGQLEEREGGKEESGRERGREDGGRREGKRSWEEKEVGRMGEGGRERGVGKRKR